MALGGSSSTSWRRSSVQLVDQPGGAGVGVDAEDVGAEDLERGGHLVENFGDFLVGDHDAILR